MPKADKSAPALSERSRLVALILASFAGFAGVHRFYTGKIGSGVAQLCTLGGFGLWWLADCVIIAAGDFRDSDGRRLYHWTLDEDSVLAMRAPDNEALLETVDDMRRELGEMQERVDFMERMIAQVKQDKLLPPRQ